LNVATTNKKKEQKMNERETQETRIEHILGDDNLNVSNESLVKYLAYLKNNIIIPCELTGSDDFQWEEFYILGPGDKNEYEELKKTRPSYKDIYTFISIDEQIEDMPGLMVKVKRISDRKQFVLPLVDLKVTNTKSPNFQLIDDYADWYVNY
jgi:hypothetical protein